MKIRFWGVRGSLAKPGPTTLRYGGNTSCVEARAADGTLIVLDCGTGSHDLGQALLASGEHPVRGHLLITHAHWDHIQGFPFFGPLYVPGNEWDVYAPGGPGHHLEETLAGQMAYTYFPVTIRQLAATIRYHDLAEGTFTLGGVRATSRYLNHPALTLGYRLEADGASVAYITDHEPHARYQPDPADLAGDSPRALPPHSEDQRHIEFMQGVDLLIHDAQYTLAEYPQKVGWGHTPAEQAVDYAIAAGVGQLALFHHDPLRNDDALDHLLEVCRRRAALAGSALVVSAASEGHIVELNGRPATPVAAPVAASAFPDLPEGAPPTVLIVDDDPDVERLLRTTLRPEGYRLLSAGDGLSALRIARAEHPALILLDWQMPEMNGIEVCLALRADPDPLLREAPVVLLTSMSRAGDLAEGFAAGATDYLTKPFSPAHVRTRVRGWLARTTAGSAGLA